MFNSIRTKIFPILVAALLGCAVLSTSASAKPRVETIQFRSKLINAMLPYSVALPEDYDDSTTTRYPVLYLLHGLTGHYNDWFSRTNVADYAAQYRLIVVTPEGNDSWYIDSTAVPTEKYESYILNEIIPDVQARYRTIEARYARAIAGLSMGGYGAVKFGLKSPSTFAFVGSMSGAFGITRVDDQGIQWAALKNSMKVFGAVGSDTRKQNDVFELIKQLPANRISSLPFIYFDSGTEDAGVFADNRELAALLVEKKIPHEYRELPGDHSWGYWDRQVQEVLRIALRNLNVRPTMEPPRSQPKLIPARKVRAPKKN
jgi:S-formylglutathione hydrolase FrmB